MSGIVRRIADIIVPALADKLTAAEQRELHKAFLMLEATVRDVAVIRSGGVVGSSGGAAMEGPGIDVVGIRVGLGADTILLCDSGGDPVREFAFTAPGLDLATADAVSGDIILIPAGTLNGDHALKAGVHYVGASRYATKLTGLITGAAGATVEQLTITRTANDANDLKGVVMGVAGTVYLHSVDVILAQSGAGDARALSSEANSAIIEAWNCYLNGDSTSGSGWARWRDTGTTASTYVYGGRAVGSTAPANAL